MLSGGPSRDGSGAAASIYTVMNMHWESHLFELPALPTGGRWHVFVNTALAPPEDVWPPGSEPPLADQRWLMVGDRSVVVLLGK